VKLARLKCSFYHIIPPFRKLYFIIDVLSRRSGAQIIWFQKVGVIHIFPGLWIMLLIISVFVDFAE